MSQLPNRVLKFQDPDGSFLKQHRAAIIGGSVGGAVFVAATCAAWWVYIRRRSHTVAHSHFVSYFFSRRDKKERKKGKYARVASDHETYPLTMAQ